MSTEDDGFNSKNWVWVPDDNNFFSKGYITDYLQDGNCKVTIIDGNHETNKIVESDKLENCNPTKFNKCDDMAELTHLNEPSVVYNLYLRYNDDLIYTYSGLFLVAINPYKSLPIYEKKVLKKFHNHEYERPPPHIFATAEGTYRNLLSNHKDQSILVTGESGAGKTENTKKIIQYLSSITSIDNTMKNNNHTIDIKILQANPILESFGNAKTIKNNNSSRFGKFIKIYFSSEGIINGANIDYYLLEKSRVVGQSEEERNYHIFYQFIKGLDKSKLKGFGLSDDVKNYNYLSGSKTNIPNTDDAKDFNFLVDAFNTMGFTDKEVTNILSILAIILHLGNLEFNSWKAEQASFKADAPIDIIIDLLGISRQDFLDNILRPKVKAGREFVQKSKKAPEVKYAVDALAKHLYERVFQYIIERINDNLKNETHQGTLNFIGVLDIAGFEIFKQNSFEQLCINYTNEKLQQYFNHHSFILEQSEYLREDIQWEFIDFGQDLQPTIDLIETRNPMGVLEILNEECMVPKASDKTFIEKLAANWGKGQSSKFQQNKLKNGFIIHHYAGKVEYNVDNWLQKNNDPVNENVLKLLPFSENQFVKDLFINDEHLVQNNSNKRRLKTTSQKHKEQLSSLMDQLSRTEPHFVRCILPNLEKKPNKLDKNLILHQLRCNGVLEGIRITRAGYPNRMTFDDFCSRYSILNKKEVFTKNTKTNSELILKHVHLDVDSYKVGITKIFFKNGILGKLEELRDLSLKSTFTDLQSLIRGNSTRASMKSKISEIQSSQLLARTFKTMDESLNLSPWMDLFIHIKPLLEDSVKVLDTKEMNENLKRANDKLEDTLKSKEKLESENERLRNQMNKLENEIIATTSMVKERDSLVEKLKKLEQEGIKNISELKNKIESTKQESSKLSNDNSAIEKKLEESYKKIKQNESQINELNDKHSASSSRIAELESSIRLHEEEKLKHKSLIANLEKEHSTSRELVDLEANKLRDLNQQLKSQLQSIETKHSELVPEHESLTKKLTSLKESIAIDKNSGTEKEKEIKSLRSNAEASEKQINELQSQLTEMKAYSDKIKSELAQVTRDLKLKEDTYKKLENESSQLKKEVKSLRDTENSLKQKHAKERIDLQDISLLREKLATAVNENTTITKSLESLKTEYESSKKANAEYTNQIVTLNHKLKELEIFAKENEKEKENLPPEPSFKGEYANMKLKLNEHSAMLRKEKFENKKLSEELNMLKARKSFEESKNEASLNRRSLAIGEGISLRSGVDTLNEEIESLKLKLEQEEANSQRAENYAIELQKKLNKLQSTRGINSWTDYEKKYRDSQVRVTELEKKFQDILTTDESVSIPSPLSKSENLSRSSMSLSSSNQDFVKIYQDITKTLKSTREELTVAKSEILRLKSLLRESEDELYDAKRLSFRSSVSNYEEELAQLKVRNDSLFSQNSDINRSLELYKKRSDEYYRKLELAESAVQISKRHEQAAIRELTEIKNQLKLAREESRASQIMIKEIRNENSVLEEKINDKNFELQKVKSRMSVVNDKLDYHTKNYGNKELNEKYKEEIRNLHKDLNFKMETETNLVKENKRLQLDYEDLVAEKDSLDKELSLKLAKLSELEYLSSDLAKKLRVLDNEKVIHERKINNLSKQITSLKELVTETTSQRDELLETKETLEEQIIQLNQKLDDNATQIHQYESDMSILRDHLENQREASTTMRSELNQSKILSRGDIQDYQKVKREVLITSEENDSLKRVNKELSSKVQILEEKLYGNEQLKYWETKVNDLTRDLDISHNENYNTSKTIKNLEREIKKLEIRVENESQLTKKYNDENFDYQNKVSHYKSTIDILHNESMEKDLLLKASERENLEMKENMLMLEREVLSLKERVEINT
ncbi:uncharacterized protein AC631_01142 [Debaryomyces fabryi]|uniref:Myosin motor domain-containing protein n=1 Tax=Debaryomyces fabryi TaxID=58627 RepID=A0A0V1Q3U2_9ASCO|nr:uncharacterized protein AC631_01142 [Debaryomyces fabryi]KSA03129.1 hypothetical protein AC631_01142 [Debaryomyces fabryi]CUM46006.1 unnamed protein product [Debaryomyces fabryi]